MTKVWLCQAHMNRQRAGDPRSIDNYRLHKTRCELCELEQAFGHAAKAMLRRELKGKA